MTMTVGRVLNYSLLINQIQMMRLYRILSLLFIRLYYCLSLYYCHSSLNQFLFRNISTLEIDLDGSSCKNRNTMESLIELIRTCSNLLPLHRSNSHMSRISRSTLGALCFDISLVASRVYQSIVIGW